MANQSTRILPSATGRGLTRGAQGFVAAREANRLNELNKRRADVDERRVGIQEQAFAFNRLLQFGALMPPGTAIKDNPFLIEIARDAFSDLDDPTFEAVSGMIPNRETLQTLMDEQQKLFVQGLDPENEVDAQLLEDINISALGLGVQSQGQLDVRRKVTGLTGDALDAFSTDTAVQGNMARQILGVEQTLTIPGFVDDTGELITFDSEAAAQIYAAVSMNREDNFSASLRLTEQSRLDVAEELMTAAEGAGIGLGRPKAVQIVQAYAASVETPEGEIAPIDTLFNRSNPEVQQAIKLFVGAIDLGDTAFDRFLAQSEAGRSLALLGGLGTFISDRLNVPNADIMATFQEFLNSEIGEEVGVSVTGGIIRRRRFNLEERAPTDTITDRRMNRLNGDGGSLPSSTNSDVVSAANLMRRGDRTEAQLREAGIADSIVDAAVRLNEENR